MIAVIFRISTQISRTLGFAAAADVMGSVFPPWVPLPRKWSRPGSFDNHPFGMIQN